MYGVRFYLFGTGWLLIRMLMRKRLVGIREKYGLAGKFYFVNTVEFMNLAKR